MVQNTIQAVEPGEEPINEGDEIDRRLMDAEAEDGEGEQEEQDGGEQGGVQDSCGSSSGILLLAGLAFIGFVAHRRRRRG
jgi:MYXO-CTERM domain-containing protein